MNEHKTIIDNNGYIVEKCVLVKDEQLQGFTLEEDQQAVEFVDDIKQVVNNRTELLLKPQWNGTEWIETATQEELNEAYPIEVTILTLEERIAMLENLQLQQEGVI